MIFKAKIVGVNNNTLTVALLIGFAACILLICVYISTLLKYIPYVFALMVICAIVFMILNKGEISIYNLDKDLIVCEDHFEIEHILFPFKEITDLLFHFESFQNMFPYRYETDPDLKAGLKSMSERSYGINNTISFNYKNQSFTYNFFVQNQAHFFQFVQTLETLYKSKIDFKEENWYGKTFLMQNVTQADFDLLLSQHV